MLQCVIGEFVRGASERPKSGRDEERKKREREEFREFGTDLLQQARAELMLAFGFRTHNFSHLMSDD